MTDSLYSQYMTESHWKMPILKLLVCIYKLPGQDIRLYVVNCHLCPE